MSVDIIDDYFRLFNLDRRSSIRELEIAYNVITKNLDQGEIFVYRNAFEYLMTEFYCVVEKQQPEEECNEQEDLWEAINNIPKTVIDSVFWCEENILHQKLSDKARLIWSIQTINMPVFFNNILTKCKNIFGFKLWTEKDMANIIKESCLNEIEYETVCFDMSADIYRNITIREIKSFVKSLKEIFKKDNYSIKKFITNDNELGASGYVIADKTTCCHICNMLKNKAEHFDLNLNISTTLKNRKEEDEL